MTALETKFKLLSHIIKVLDAAQTPEIRDTFAEKIKRESLIAQSGCIEAVADQWISDAMARSKWAEAAAQDQPRCRR